MKYVISDHHWGHKNIIKFSNRPFDNLHHMENYMIDAWNSVVTDDDEVWHLGDISFKLNAKYLVNILDRLNGKIHLIRGNHDKDSIIKKVEY